MTSRAARQIGDALVARALAGGVRLTGALPDRLVGPVVRAGTQGARLALRSGLRRNLLRALGPDRPLEQIERAFFDGAAELARYSVLTLHRGFARSGFAEEGGVLDETFAHVERAAALGRGVVIVASHQFCHELFAALVSRRTPFAAVIREDQHNPELLERWYAQLGVPTVRRPRHARAISDFRALLGALRDGAALALTPDLPARPGETAPVRWFDRPVALRGGAFWVALRARAPLVRCWIDRKGSRLSMRFSPSEMIESEPGRSTAQTVSRHLQAWTTEFEQELRARPESWGFWVDRRWSEVLSQPVGGGL